MTSLEERIYELGAEALAEQERLVVETRARGAAIIAAAAVIASLLVGPAFQHGHPTNAAEIVAGFTGLIGCAGVLLCVVLLLRPRNLAFGVSATAAYRSLWDRGVVEPPRDPHRIGRSVRAAPRRQPAHCRTPHAIPHARARLAGDGDGGTGARRGGRLVAMVNEPRKADPTPPRRAGHPAPGTVPKLPQSIFIFENRNPDGTPKRIFPRLRRQKRS